MVQTGQVLAPEAVIMSDAGAVILQAGDIVAQLEKATLEACARPEVVRTLTELGAVPDPMGAQAMDTFWKAEFTYWKRAIDAAGIPLN